jgi:hypothetical protein
LALNGLLNLGHRSLDKSTGLVTGPSIYALVSNILARDIWRLLGTSKLQRRKK